MARTSFAILAVLCGAGASAWAEPLGCLIQPYQEAEVGSQVVGVLDRVLVERGDFVKKGQPLAQLNSEVERAAMAAARSRAEATAELQAAASGHDFAQKKKARTHDLFQKSFVSQQIKDQSSTEADVAEMRLKQAREQQKLAQQELALANAQLNQRTIRSPLSGLVVERYLAEGERVEDRPVVKVATVDPLRVEVIVPSSHFSRIKQGMSATVKPELPDTEARIAKVTVVDRVIDAASNSFRVRLELANSDNALPPGLRCKVEFDVAAAPADPTAKPAADQSAKPTADRNAKPTADPGGKPTADQGGKRAADKGGQPAGKAAIAAAPPK